VVTGGLATGAASYFGGAVTANGAGSTNYSTANPTLNLTRTSTPAGNFIQFQGRTAYDTYIGTIGTAAGIATTNDDLVIGQKGNAPTFAITPSTGAATFAGAVSVATGAAVGGATAGAGGLAFPATAVAVANANTLDDYEEGTFTPVISGTTTAGIGTYSVQSGAYVKIGKCVQYQIYIVLTAHTGTGDLAISGLPETANASFYPPAAVYVNNLALSANNYPQITVLASSSSFFIRQVPTGGGAAAAIPLDTSFDILLTGTYQV